MLSLTSLDTNTRPRKAQQEQQHIFLPRLAPGGPNRRGKSPGSTGQAEEEEA
ncbi:hypothetical protein DACRYDRAFT_24135 [Dacryopinax primogenitus]|uniref:Uncharacterized protein n=1 Tax=Dacryopinax primogenitus (strain DJM 731) TaxID=1858805 RepID=M5G5M1_DACPD|nr:uncharacterized protein DACRYDRAFT_24135 [Dacryopinax primogenitus]EJT99057.1 hypothetical protein DACRYDRAFT_24135 [Dacryopinax primogenitus]